MKWSLLIFYVIVVGMLFYARHRENKAALKWVQAERAHACLVIVGMLFEVNEERQLFFPRTSTGYNWEFMLSVIEKVGMETAARPHEKKRFNLFIARAKQPHRPNSS